MAASALSRHSAVFTRGSNDSARPSIPSVLGSGRPSSSSAFPLEMQGCAHGGDPTAEQLLSDRLLFRRQALEHGRPVGAAGIEPLGAPRGGIGRCRPALHRFPLAQLSSLAPPSAWRGPARATSSGTDCWPRANGPFPARRPVLGWLVTWRGPMVQFAGPVDLRTLEGWPRAGAVAGCRPLTGRRPGGTRPSGTRPGDGEGHPGLAGEAERAGGAPCALQGLTSRGRVQARSSRCRPPAVPGAQSGWGPTLGVPGGVRLRQP